MATADVEGYSNPLITYPFVRRDPPPLERAQKDSSQLPTEICALIQKVQDIEKALGFASIDQSKIPQVQDKVLHRSIVNLHSQITKPIGRQENIPSSALGLILLWLKEKITAVAIAIYKVFFALFKKQPPEVTIDAILEELRLCQAISPAQYEAVVQLAKEPDKKPALILLSTLLGFPTTELSSLLENALNRSPEYAFSLLLECFLIKKFSSLGSLRQLINESDRQHLLHISFDGLMSNEHIKGQLRCLRSLSSRLTIRSWVINLSHLLGAQIPQEVITECTNALKNNDPKAFAKSLSPFLTTLASAPLSNESLYAKELLSYVSSDLRFDGLAIEIRKQKFINQWSEQVCAIQKAAKTLVTAHACNRTAYLALTKAHNLLTNEAVRNRYLPTWVSICETFRATQEGCIARNVRKIDSAIKRLSSVHDSPEQAQEARKPPKHIVHLACSCGGGHKGMVQALNNSLRASAARSAYHFTSQTLDVPRQVTQPLDSIYGLFQHFGLSIDTTAIYNFLLRNDLCSVIEFLKWLTSGDPSPSSAEKKQSLIRQALLAQDPDFLNMVYAFDGNDIDEVSQQLGLPLAYVATDFDLNDWKHAPSSPFFREAVPSLHHSAIRRTLHVPEEKIEEIGLCVGPEFEKPLSSHELSAVRWRYGIASHERVILLSSGGAALQNTIPERIALGYNDPSKPIHLLVVCGTNESFKEYLETKVYPHIPQGAPVKMTVLGFQQRAQMAELTQLADVVIGKPGGMSTMEFVKSGAKVIFDETSARMHWEKFNASIVVNSGRGTIMNHPDEILPLIKESLVSSRRTPMRMAQVRGSERYTDLVNKLLTQANSTEAEHGWREKRRSWHKMNKRMGDVFIR
jgi:hypothetical protein